MKKLVLFFAVAFARSFAACTPKAGEATTSSEDTLNVEAPAVPNDTTDSITTVVEEVVEEVVAE